MSNCKHLSFHAIVQSHLQEAIEVLTLPMYLLRVNEPTEHRAAIHCIGVIMETIGEKVGGHLSLDVIVVGSRKQQRDIVNTSRMISKT